ncbi:MAG: winged helix-turn-helix transcriptional regulator [Methanomicrobium sp.]|nr:winged helix-turn-helix transcriptional regulator [Methanomicrobium sp.]
MNFLSERAIALIILLLILISFSETAYAEDDIIQIRNGYIVKSAYGINTSGYEELESRQVQFSELGFREQFHIIISENFPYLGEILLLLIYSGIITFFGIRHITKNNILNHPIRKDIFRTIEEKPGINFTEIVNNTNITKTMAKYHLDKLSAFGFIRLFSEDGHSGYFKNNNAFSVPNMKLIIAQKNVKKSHIIDILTLYPGISRNELSAMADISGPSVTWHMKRMQKSGLVEIVKDGRSNRYYLNDIQKTEGKKEPEENYQNYPNLDISNPQQIEEKI